MKKLSILLAIVIFAYFSLGFSCGNPTPDPTQGFYIIVRANGIQTGAQVQGTYLSGSPTQGTVSSFNYPSINGVGLTPVQGARVPGTWRLTYGPSFDGGSLCLGFLTTDRTVSPGSQETLNCIPRYFSFTAYPDSIDALNPPATVDVTGAGSENLTGIPMIAFYDELGNVAASGPASALLYDKDGVVAGVRVNVSTLSQAYDGTYTGLIHNVNSDGSWEVVAAAAITVYGNPAPPPPPPPPPGNCEPDPDHPILECPPEN